LLYGTKNTYIATPYASMLFISVRRLSHLAHPLSPSRNIIIIFLKFHLGSNAVTSTNHLIAKAPSRSTQWFANHNQSKPDPFGALYRGVQAA